MATTILEDILKELEDLLDDAKEAVGDGDPTASEKTSIEGWLDDCDNIINQVFDPNEAPSLTPANAGTVDETIIRTPLVTCAANSYTLAFEAHGNSTLLNPNYVYIGSRLKTLRDWMIPNYRVLLESA